MCGICGVFDNSKSYKKEDLLEINETMYNRGPDGYGIHFENGHGIAMRRLSIIDLEGGWQPIFSEDESIVVVQNGEIYNYKELKDELEKKGHLFKTQSDTEVIVHGYEEWGIHKLLDKLDGMHGFCIWDKSKGRAFLARDRFGEKPIYYYYDGIKIVFSSQLLSVAKGVKKRLKINKSALYLYLGLHFIPGDITILDSINKLLPGEFCEIDLGNMELKKTRYWEMKEKSSKKISVEELKCAIRQSIKSRMVADVSVGVFLSGGLDSSIVAALAKEENPDIQTFSIGFTGSNVDESYYSQTVANHIGSKHNHFEFDLNSFVELIPNIIETMDEPVGDQAMLPVYLLSKEASKYVKVVMGGDGADELFGGYSYYIDKAMNMSFRTKIKHYIARFSNKNYTDSEFFKSINETPSGFPLLTNEEERLKLLKIEERPNLGKWLNNLTGKLNVTMDPLKKAEICDIETWLAEDLFMKFDKMAMANSLEGRSPYINPKLSDISMMLSSEQKIRNGDRKVLLKEVGKDILPHEIIDRRKQGFILPMKKWLANDLREELLRNIKECPDDTLDLEYLEKIVSEDLNKGVNRERLLYAILIYTKWIKHAYAVLGYE